MDSCETSRIMTPDHRAGVRAAQFIKDGMLVGLGSGSTVAWTIRRLSERIRNEGLRIKGIPTSLTTARLAFETGIPLIGFSETLRVDVTLDGAKELDSRFDMIKGGGGSFYREKLVAEQSDLRVYAINENKLVRQLGAFPVPVEISPFGWEATANRIARLLDCEVKIRIDNQGKPIESDNLNYIVDCSVGTIADAAELHSCIYVIITIIKSGCARRDVHADDI